MLHLPVNKIARLGNLGRFDLPAGFYTYVEGAFGPGGLATQLKHHLSPPRTPTRHIDYLRRETNLEEIWLAAGPISREHHWADLLPAIPGGAVLVEGFGTQHCTCDSHLVYFDLRPTLEDFKVDAGRQFPDDIILRAFARSKAHDNAPPQPHRRTA